MKIGIVSLGGKSSKLVAKSCKKYFEEVDQLDIRKFEVHMTNKGTCLSYEGKKLEDYDCVYVRGSHKYALLQRSITRSLSDETYLPIQANAFTIGHDKFLTMVELQKKKIPIPATRYAPSIPLAKTILEKEVKYPVIIKVPNGTHGKGVMVAESAKSAKTILDMLEGVNQSFIIQEFVKTKKTSDIRVIVVGGQVVAAYKRVAAKGEARANIHSGGERLPHKLTPEQANLAIASAEAVGADICGVDILNAKKPSVIEINLSPALHSLKDVTGVNVSRLVAKYLYDMSCEFKSGKESILRFDHIKNVFGYIAEKGEKLFDYTFDRNFYDR